MITTVGKAMGGLRRRGAAPVTTMRRWRYDRALRKAGVSEAFISTLTDEQRRRTPAQVWGAPFSWRQERAINKAMKDATVPQWLLDTPIDEWRWRYDRAMRDAGFDAAFVASLTDEKRRAVKPAAWSEPGPVPQWVTDMAASGAEALPEWA